MVIAAFWREHHSMYENVERATPTLLRANLLWLASIVFLPFPTVLLAADHDERLTHGIYIGTLVVALGSQSLQAWLIRRDQGRTSDAPVRGDLISLGLVIVAFVAAVTIPPAGLYCLLLLLLSSPIERVLTRREKQPHS